MTDVRLIVGSTIPGQPLFSPDLYWKIRFEVFDPIAFFEFRDSAIAVGGWDMECAQMQEELPGFAYQAMDCLSGKAIAEFLKERRCGSVTLHPDTPSDIQRALMLEGIGVVVQKREEPWYPERLSKTDAEVAHIVSVQRSVERAVTKAAQHLQNARISSGGVLMRSSETPLTAEWLREQMHLQLLRDNCIGVSTIVACGAKSFFPHWQGKGPLNAYWPIVIDIFPRSLEHHYCADMTRTFFVGRPSAEHEKMYLAVKRAMELVTSLYAAGASLYAVYKETEKLLTSEGFPTHTTPGKNKEGLIHGISHGIGLEIHEEPMQYIDAVPDRCILTVEPGLYYEKPGGIRLENMILVEKSGAKTLTNFPTELEAAVLG